MKSLMKISLFFQFSFDKSLQQPEILNGNKLHLLEGYLNYDQEIDEHVK